MFSDTLKNFLRPLDYLNLNFIKIAAPQNEELMSKILYSKYIIRHQDKSANQIKKSTYFESLSNDLILAANQSVIQYEKTTHVKKSFYFHDDAIKHLCRLTRVLVSLVLFKITCFNQID